MHHSPSLREFKIGTQNRADVGTDAEATEECCLLTGLLGLLRLLSYSIQNHQPRGGPATVSWFLSHQSSDKTMQRLSGASEEGF